jgi:hypothetical protein
MFSTCVIPSRSNATLPVSEGSVFARTLRLCVGNMEKSNVMPDSSCNMSRLVSASTSVAESTALPPGGSGGSGAAAPTIC